MITVLTGDDDFAISEEVSRLVADFDGVAERIDGESLQLRDLPDLLMGSSLFADKRLVIVQDLSKSAAVWQKMSEWIDRLSDDITLVLVEAKLDKRTLVYKELNQKANIKELAKWSERDTGLAVDWAKTRAKAAGLDMTGAALSHLVSRVGADKWRLSQAIDILSLAEPPIDQATIDRSIVLTASENIFELFEAALNSKPDRVREIIKTLELQEEVYAVFALIVGQAVQLLAIASAPQGSSPEKDLAIHPFVASKLRQQARRLGIRKVESIAKEVAETDIALKTLSGDPWLLVETTLIKIAQ